MDLQTNLMFKSYVIDERMLHCGNKCSRKKETNFKRKSTISLMEIFFLFTIMTLIVTQYGTSAKKTKKWKETCTTQSTQWDECSKPCDMGVSFRVVTTPKCKLKRENRLCVVRHCNEARFKPPIKVRTFVRFKNKLTS